MKNDRLTQEHHLKQNTITETRISVSKLKKKNITVPRMTKENNELEKIYKLIEKK